MSVKRRCRHITAEINGSGEYKVITIIQSKHLKVEVECLEDGDHFFVPFSKTPGNTNAAEKGVMKTVKMAHQAKCSGCRYRKEAALKSTT